MRHHGLCMVGCGVLKTIVQMETEHQENCKDFPSSPDLCNELYIALYTGI